MIFRFLTSIFRQGEYFISNLPIFKSRNVTLVLGKSRQQLRGRTWLFISLFSALSEVTLTVVLPRSYCWKSLLWKTLPV